MCDTKYATELGSCAGATWIGFREKRYTSQSQLIQGIVITGCIYDKVILTRIMQTIMCIPQVCVGCHYVYMTICCVG